MRIDEIGYHKDFVHTCNFNNWLIMKNHYPDGYGWIHVEGKALMSVFLKNEEKWKRNKKTGKVIRSGW